jgi:hypothetical protein
VSPRSGRATTPAPNLVRDELLSTEEFALLADATIVVEAWQVSYDTRRPHPALRGLTPAGYAQHGTNQRQPARP